MCIERASGVVVVVLLQYPGLVILFAHDTNFDCNALIQATYTAG